MASGGQQSPLKRIRQNGNQVNHHNSGFGDTQWTLLPNNLELNSRSKPTKKQRNKEKTRTTASTESSPSSQSSPCIGHNSGTQSSTSHSFPRTKFTTASWLKDQLSTSGSKKNSACSDLDETVSDIEHPAINRRNIDMPVNQRHQGTRIQDTQSVSSRRSVTENESSKAFKEDNTKKVPDTTIIVERLMHLRECINQVTTIMQNLEKSDDKGAREQMNKLSNLLKQLLQEEQEHLDLLQQVLTPCEESSVAIDGDSPTAAASRMSTPSKGSRISSKDINGNEDEKMNKQNHLLEKMKESQEKLTALKHQQAALVSLQKKAEDKLAEARAFHAQLIKSNPEIGQSDQEWQYASSDRSLHSGGIDECAVNGDTDWDNEVYQDPQPQWQSTNPKKQKNPSQGTVHSSGWQEEPQATSSSIHTNIENLRQRVQILQELSDDRNLVETLSADDTELAEAGERAAAVEWQRKKLENKLMELHEKKLQMNQLLKELSTLQEESKSGSTSKSCGTADSAFPVPALRDTQQFLQTVDTEEKKRKLDEMKETLLQLQGMVNNLGVTNDHDTPGLSQDSREESPLNFASASSQRETSVSELSHQPASVKRDNIRKEQSAGFPARRHYEAEGRANEDADVPPVATGALPTPDQNSWDSDPRIQEKIRKLQDAKDKLQKIQGLMNSIQQAKQSGQQIPVEYLQLLSSLKDEAEEVDEEDELEDSNDADRDDDDLSSINQSNITDISATGIKEICKDISTSHKRPNDNDGHGDSEENVQQHESELERLMEERTRLLRVHEQLVRLQQNLPGPSRKNNEQIRSSGEGGNLQKKKPHRSDSLISPCDATHSQARKERSRQDNLLLTRQNVANMESQSRIDNIPNIPAKDIVSAKKDNINNLSANLSKHALQNSSVRVVPDSLVKDNTDTLSALSAELNQSLSLRDELRRKKAVLEDLLSQDRSKQQDYSRNQDNQSHSGSSVNSEPLEGSSSVLAPDTTVAATWGGSSTQDNFEDEGEEPIESLEEQEEEEGSNNEGIEHVQTEQGRSILSQFSTEAPFSEFDVNPSSKRRDNRLPQEFKGAQINQWTTRKNFPRVSNNRTHASLDGPHPENFLPEETAMQQEEVPQVPTSVSEANNSSMSVKFAQQLQQQLEQLNALCQSMLTEQQVMPANAPRNLPCSYALPNPFTGRPSQPVPDIMHHYTQQLQLQQQLLLSLSQCYHNLYLQQLEIQHLQRCVQQSPDSEANLHHSSTLNPQGPNSEDFAFRPWFLSPWLNTAMPSMPFSQSQISPMSAPPFLQPPQPSFTFSPTSVAPSAPPCALAAGSQPSRSVVHPAGQDNRPIPETLNNQVPPRTRANNFWDNFRSYSRQNLLSTSNTAKSNETSGLPAAPQIRPVHPASSNENSLNQRSRDFVPSHTENGVSACQGFERVFERPMANSELQELMTKSKKPNLNKHQALTATRSTSDIPRRTPASLNLSTAVEHSRSNAVTAQNIHSSVPLPTCSPSVNFSRPYHPQHGSKVGEFTSLSSALPSEALRESIYAEVSKLVSQNEFQSDFLVELFQELQNLRSDTLRQRALNAVREMVMREEKGDSKSATNEDRNKIDNQTCNHKPRESTEQLIDIIQDDNAFPTSPSVSDSHNTKTAVENVAMAPPLSLGKVQASKPSTGAVKKKTASKVSHVHPSVSNNSYMSQDVTEQSSQSSTSSTIESSQSLVEKVVLDLIPYLQSHVMDECCPNRRSKICARIMDILQANSSTPLSRFFRSQLQQILHRTITKYLGLRLCDCEADLLKNITEVLFKELTFHKLMAQAPEESAETSETVIEVSPQPDVLLQSVKTVSSGEKKKQGTISKDCHSELSRVIDSSGDLIDSTSQESESQISERPTKMLIGESAVLPLQFGTLPQHEVARGAVGGESAFVSHCVTWPVQAGNPEEDMGYECDPEAETEPEVEAETEADLAEADQSPGQQGAVTVPTPGDIRHSDPVQGTSGRSGTVIALTEDSPVSVEGVSGDAISEALQVSCTDGNPDQEVTLDDIPTKLTPLSEEELQRQMTEEQVSNSLLQDVIEDIALAGEGDTVREPAAF